MNNKSPLNWLPGFLFYSNHDDITGSSGEYVFTGFLRFIYCRRLRTALSAAQLNRNVTRMIPGHPELRFSRTPGSQLSIYQLRNVAEIRSSRSIDAPVFGTFVGSGGFSGARPPQTSLYSAVHRGTASRDPGHNAVARRVG